MAKITHNKCSNCGYNFWDDAPTADKKCPACGVRLV